MQETSSSKKLPYHLTDHDQLYFLHMAKTAGRSFEDLLKIFFNPQQTIRIDVEHGYPQDIAANVFNKYQLYLGHLGYHFTTLFPDDKKPLWITMLRDPVERVISFYYFFRNTKPVKPGHINYKHQVMANELNLLQFVESEEAAELVENYQFHNLIDSEMLYFTAKDHRQFRNSKSDEELLTIAKSRLQDECIFFGITERYDSSVALLCYTFGWDLPRQKPEKLNVTPEKPDKTTNTPEIIEAIRRKVPLDIEIYSFACELFEKRLNAMISHLLSKVPDQVKTTNRKDSANTSAAFNPKLNSEYILQKAYINSLKASPVSGLAITLQEQLKAWKLKLWSRLGMLTPPILFDAKWYLEQNPDVNKSGMNPYLHYKTWGWKEGRNPSAQIDILWYLSSNPDIVNAGVEPLEHYICFGEREKRSPLPPEDIFPDSIVPSSFSGPDVLEAEIKPLTDNTSLPSANIVLDNPSSNGALSFQTISIHPRSIISVQPGISNPKLCFHFPASPTDAFFSQIAMFKLSLAALGGIYKQADIIITFGDEKISPIPDKWKFLLDKNVIINWATPEEFLRKKYDAQGDAQWTYNHEKYDYVCILDADVLILRPINDLLTNITIDPAMTATIAHYPFPVNDGENSRQVWQNLATLFTGRPINFEYRHTLVEEQPGEDTFCPFYINFGFILMTPKIIQEVRETYLDIRKKVAPLLKYPYFSAQVGLALAIAANQTPTRAVGLRYNFPNDRKADHLHLNELTDVRLIHYLRTEQFDRQIIFTSKPEFEHFLSLDLTGSNKILQDYIYNLTKGIYPFPDKK